VLDVGCGPGVPIARALARRFTVTGVDISSAMIARARANVPEGVFIHGDIMSVDLQPAHFDAVVAFYSIFHLPREEHPELFRRIHRWLKPGGYLLATVSARSQEPYTEDDFIGVPMYWSNYGLEEYERMLAEIGFDPLESAVIGHGYEEAHQAADEHHPLIFAQKSFCFSAEGPSSANMRRRRG
jgi:SAM-dependent methyltransferase